MTGGSRIVAIDASAPEGAPAEQQPAGEELYVPAEEDSHWDYTPAVPPRDPWRIVATALSVLAIVGWTAWFGYVNRSAMSAGSPEQWTAWLRDWAVPVLLVGVAWLIAMRNSRREAARFASAARLLGDESSRLEQRLATVNGELSLAREFLASQSRDLEALGRMATERLSLHSQQLASLIQDNGSRIDTIGSVSTAALENMERLRGQLPVIASSAKDVTNNIAAAGRSAKTQLEEMVQGFNRLNQFGQASERQVQSLREAVDTTLAEFTRQTGQLETLATERFSALALDGEAFRTQLDGHEVAALAAIRTRAATMTEELEQIRTQLDDQEAESLASLRARLAAVRDEGTAIGRSIREGESAALAAWQGAIVMLEDDLRSALGKVEEIDQRAVDAACKRLETLAGEADELDARMTERDRLFVEEVERRRIEFDARHDEFSERLTARLAALDSDIAIRQASHAEHSTAMAANAEAMAGQLDELAARMHEIAAHGSAAESALAASLTTLADRLTASRTALGGTESEIAGLTDASVRLLELIRASVDHSAHDLPEAIATGEARLQEIEHRAAALSLATQQAASHGSSLSDYVIKSDADLSTAMERLGSFHADLDRRSQDHLGTLNRIRGELEAVAAQSASLADHAQGELGSSIERLNVAAREAVAGIDTMSARSVREIAARLGEESATAIDQAMRARAAEAAVQLEDAAAHAAGVSREAAIQLRDQLAKVNELAGHLERRVAHARSRAEEQVDNDFSRRVALITESLNSNAIDIARAMDSDVSDTAWASYLKGDRGIFTRRAVKLLETPDAKAVAQLYSDDSSFRENVSRYIHDFEAMLRQLLSTRDGHALGVTLLSSDMGKLYVALAQAIERLRN